nr:methyltransferase [Flavihumibacter stibioxidans]
MADRFPDAKGNEGLPPGHSVLDIGAGTGLLSLMLARQLYAVIDAVELEENAFSQAQENVGASKWNQRISVHHADILDFKSFRRYELVISNPPFFENSLKSVYSHRNLAKHEAALDLQVLFRLAEAFTTADGCFALLLPAERVDDAIQNAHSAAMHLRNKAMVRQTEKHGYFRTMLIFSKEKGIAKEEEISIRREGNYTERFSALLQPYYLFL